MNIKHNVFLNKPIQEYIKNLNKRQSVNGIIINWNNKPDGLIINDDMARHTYLAINDSYEIDYYIMIIQKYNNKISSYVLMLNKNKIFDFVDLNEINYKDYNSLAYSLAVKTEKSISEKRKLEQLFNCSDLNPRCTVLSNGNEVKELFKIKVFYDKSIATTEKEILDFKYKTPKEIGDYCNNLLTKYKNVTFNLDNEKQLQISKQIVSTIRCQFYFDILSDVDQLGNFSRNFYAYVEDGISSVDSYIVDKEKFQSLKNFIYTFKRPDGNDIHSDLSIHVNKEFFINIADYWTDEDEE